MSVFETAFYNAYVIYTILDMISLAREKECTVRQKLNGVTVFVEGDSNPYHIFRDQQRTQSGCIKGDVGPYPKAELTAEEVANDARIMEANRRRRAGPMRVYARNAELARTRFQNK